MVNHPTCNDYLAQLEQIKKEVQSMIYTFYTSKGISYANEPNKPDLRTQQFVLSISQQKKDAIQSLKRELEALEKIKI